MPPKKPLAASRKAELDKNPQFLGAKEEAEEVVVALNRYSRNMANIGGWKYSSVTGKAVLRLPVNLSKDAVKIASMMSLHKDHLMKLPLPPEIQETVSLVSAVSDGGGIEAPCLILSNPYAVIERFPEALVIVDAKEHKDEKTVSITAKEFAARLASHDGFTVRKELPNFELFPFANDYGFDSVIKILPEYQTAPSKKIKVALLFGESNFLSLLPELERLGITVVILADIHPELHLHTKHLCECIERSDAWYDFLDNYAQNHPLFKQNFKSTLNAKQYDSVGKLQEFMLFSSKFLFPKYHFLSSEIRYDECKKAASKMEFANIHLDLHDAKQCYDFINYLELNNAEVVVFNFTNIASTVVGTSFSIYMLLNASHNKKFLYSKMVAMQGFPQPRPCIQIEDDRDKFIAVTASAHAGSWPVIKDDFEKELRKIKAIKGSDDEFIKKLTNDINTLFLDQVKKGDLKRVGSAQSQFHAPISNSMQQVSRESPISHSPLSTNKPG